MTQHVQHATGFNDRVCEHARMWTSSCRPDATEIMAVCIRAPSAGIQVNSGCDPETDRRKFPSKSSLIAAHALGNTYSLNQARNIIFWVQIEASRQNEHHQITRVECTAGDSTVKPAGSSRQSTQHFAGASQPNTPPTHDFHVRTCRACASRSRRSENKPPS